ncbi:MAG: hypothetical protein ACTHK7_06555 [Aureliella sp.]
MRFRIIDAALLVATIAGAVVAVGTARMLHGLQAEHARLSRMTGELVITDPALLHVQAIETGDPLHFAWRVYAPASQLRVFESTGGHGRSTSTNSDSTPREFIARIRFTAGSSAEQTTVYSSFRSGSSLWSFGSAEMLQFLIDHRREIEIEQLGAHETASIKPGQPATLLKITVPENLVDQARQAFRDPNATPLVPNVFECRVEFNP